MHHAQSPAPVPAAPAPLYLQPVDTGPIPVSPPGPARSPSVSVPGVLVVGWIGLVVFVLSHVWVAAWPGAAFVAAGLLKLAMLGMGLGLMTRALRATTEPTARAGLAIAAAILVFAALGNGMWVLPS